MEAFSSLLEIQAWLPISQALSPPLRTRKSLKEPMFLLWELQDQRLRDWEQWRVNEYKSRKALGSVWSSRWPNLLVPWWTLWLLWLLTCRSKALTQKEWGLHHCCSVVTMCPGLATIPVQCSLPQMSWLLCSLDHTWVSRPKREMNNLPGKPGRPGRPGGPGKPSLPGRPAAPTVVWPGFPLFPFRPGTPCGPGSPGTPWKISPHKNTNHITPLTLRGYSTQWHTLETKLQGKNLGKHLSFSYIKVKKVFGNLLT